MSTEQFSFTPEDERAELQLDALIEELAEPYLVKFAGTDGIINYQAFARAVLQGGRRRG